MVTLDDNSREGLQKALGGRCKLLSSSLENLADFIQIVGGVEDAGRIWYRGQADIAWELKPKAYRFESEAQQARALALLQDFRRHAITKIETPPPQNEEIEWLGIAQHYGLPTQLLDWTKNPAMALYFACCEYRDTGGAVYLFQPSDLNRRASSQLGKPISGGVYDAEVEEDRHLIRKYVNASEARGCIALNPAYNSARILQQKGAFTLHADNTEITKDEAPSLTAISIPAKRKQRLLRELSVIGIDEMSIFPELEHMCKHLTKQILR